MDIERAQEIFHSNEGATVVYNERVVFIKDIDPQSGMATITSDKEEMVVPIKDLYEFPYA